MNKKRIYPKKIKKPPAEMIIGGIYTSRMKDDCEPLSYHMLCEISSAGTFMYVMICLQGMYVDSGKNNSCLYKNGMNLDDLMKSYELVSPSLFDFIQTHEVR